jgi:pimeloyl-ACP methyl ester carboxylesterase
MIPTVDFGGTGPTLIFLHANGYPPGSYRPLLENLARWYRATAMVQRPLWQGSDPRDIGDWAPLSSDLLQYVEERRSAPAMVVGHSLGAIVGLRAALRQPAKFRALVLIEPVLFPPWRILQARWLRLIGRLDRHPLVLASRKRRQTFDDLDRLLRSYRQRRVFRYMEDAALRAHVDAMTCPDGDGSYRLYYRVAWEARIYATGIWGDLDLWRGLRKHRLPTLILRGAETDTFWAATAQRVHDVNPAIQITTLPAATHLLPLEKPFETAAAIQTYFAAVASDQ